MATQAAQAPSTGAPFLPVPHELSQLQSAVLAAICQLHTPQIAFSGELEADVIADEPWELMAVWLLNGAVDNFGENHMAS